MANQNFNTFNTAATTDQAFDAGLRAHMVRVYNYMASGLALSGIVAYALMATPGLQQIFFTMGMTRGGSIVAVGPNLLGWIAILAPIGLLLLVSFRAAQMSVGSVQAIY
ncbi:MAG: BAX inhibitor (BI)-1/YccA family protein, partial [Proteobacteria bacterium]|nr:BAX inhibitor (BI)-1/YccA family protein [Pseudomonadota bacterium]